MIDREHYDVDDDLGEPAPVLPPYRRSVAAWVTALAWYALGLIAGLALLRLVGMAFGWWAG